MKRKRLTPDQKAKIIEYYGRYNNKWTFIAFRMNLPESTVRSFIKEYKKRGRPPKITSDQIEGVVQTFEETPETTLREAKKETDISITSMLKILHEFDIKYFRKIAISKLTEQHKQKRVEFSQMMSDVLPNSSLNIIISDESTIEVNLLKGGIWSRRGHYPPGSFKEKEPYPIHVMVWGNWPHRIQNQASQS